MFNVIALVQEDDFYRRKNGVTYSAGYVYYGYSDSNRMNDHSMEDWVIRKVPIE